MKSSNNALPVPAPPMAPKRDELERELQSLQREIRQRQLKRDLLKKANELSGKAWVSIACS